MKKEEFQAAVKRHQGMDEDGKKALEKVNGEADDWYTTCPVCLERITGTHFDLRKHWDEHESG